MTVALLAKQGLTLGSGMERTSLDNPRFWHRLGSAELGLEPRLLLASCMALNGVASLHGLAFLICTVGRKAEPSHTSAASDKPGEHK